MWYPYPYLIPHYIPYNYLTYPDDSYKNFGRIVMTQIILANVL